jgi:hypothetical protein
MLVGELDDELSVDRARRGVELEHDRPGDFEIGLERRAGEGEHAPYRVHPSVRADDRDPLTHSQSG